MNKYLSYFLLTCVTKTIVMHMESELTLFKDFSCTTSCMYERICIFAPACVIVRLMIVNVLVTHRAGNCLSCD